MKAIELLTAALLISSVSFAQQAATKTEQAATATTAAGKTTSQLNASSSSSTDASINTGAITKAETSTRDTKNKVKKEVTAAKKKATGKTKEAVSRTREEIRENSNDKASVKADESVNTSVKNNKVSQDASLHNSTSVSADAGKSMDKAKTGVNNTLVETNGKAKTAVKKVENVAKPKPASVKMQSRIKTSAGIKIK